MTLFFFCKVGFEATYYLGGDENTVRVWGRSRKFEMSVLSFLSCIRGAMTVLEQTAGTWHGRTSGLHDNDLEGSPGVTVSTPQPGTTRFVCKGSSSTFPTHSSVTQLEPHL